MCCLSPECFALYQRIYGCEKCTGVAKDANGIRDFVLSGDRQTFPVSHFGRICQGRIWIIGMNPSGRTQNSNVHHYVKDYSAPSRSCISPDASRRIFRHFSEYFGRGAENAYPIFKRFDIFSPPLAVDGNECTFSNGGICEVDMVKCSTLQRWREYAKSAPGESNKVMLNCLGQDHNGFIYQQIEMHSPRVLICVYNTEIHFDEKFHDPHIQNRVVKKYSYADKGRIWIAVDLNKLNEANLRESRDSVQRIIDGI